MIMATATKITKNVKIAETSKNSGVGNHLKVPRIKSII